MIKQFTAPFSLWCKIEKADDESYVIGGYASVDVVDQQEDRVPIDTLKEALDLFTKDLDYAHVNVMHSNIPVGKLLLEYTDSEGETHKTRVDDKGLYILVKIRDDIKKGREVWQLIKEGKLTGFSIAGEVLASTPVHNGKAYNRIDKLELHEISVVDNPANPYSLFTVMKAIKKGNYVFKNQLLDSLPDGIILTKGIVRLVGHVPEQGFGEDYDIKSPTTKEWLGRAIQTRIHNELRRKGLLNVWKKTQWITEEDEYPYTAYQDLYDLVLLRSKQSEPDQLLLTEDEAGGVSFAPLDNAPISEANKFREWVKKSMSEEESGTPTLNEVLTQLADLGKRIEALEKAKKPKAYKPCPKKAEEEFEDLAVDALIAAGLIEKDYKACMSKCLKGGKKTFKQCVTQCKGEAKKGEDLEEAKKPKAYKKPYPEEKAKKPKAYKEPYPEEEKAKKPKAYKKPEEEEKARKPKAYKEPYPEEKKKPKKEPEEEEYGPPKAKELESMIESAIEAALEKRLGGSTTVKKSVAPSQAEGGDPLNMPLDQLHKLPFSKINRGAW